MSDVFVWILIGVGLIGGIGAPLLLREKVESIALYTIGWVWWFLFAFVGSQVMLALLMLPFEKKLFQQPAFVVTLQFLVYLVMFLVMILLPWRHWKRNKKSTAKHKRRFVLKVSGLDRRPNWEDVKRFIAYFPSYFVINMAAALILTLLVGPDIMGQEQNTGFTQEGNSPFALGLIFLCLVVLAPLFEEMLVRGVLFGKLREKLKFWPVALLTATIFALIHGQFNVGVMTFILALFAAALREKTGAIWSGIMLHMTQNLIAFCLLFLVK